MNLLKQFKPEDTFLGNYINLVKNTVIPYQEGVLKDTIDTVEKSHAIRNFELAAIKLETGQCDEPFYGMVFQDSDVAKWLEAAAYSLMLFPDPDLEARCDDVIDLIGRAQWKDGYLNTYFTLKSPDLRWTNLEEAHELYCAGHMIEAAVAYADATGKEKLLATMCNMADHIYERFVINECEGFPGHPEIELALMRLYHKTKLDKYKELALHFIDVRGADTDFYLKEFQANEWTVWGGNREKSQTEYSQAHKPVRDQVKAVGHSVRAVYLYTAMADLAAETGDASLNEACKRLWNNLTTKRMYVTGGIGSAYEGEAFTEDYHLPNDTAYAETCAAIGLIFFARKMLDLEPDSQYADIMERALYNGVLPGMALNGKKFFYVNPLEALPGISGSAKTHHHALPDRPDWFACACCPPNVARLLPSLGQYAYSIDDKTFYTHLYVGGTIDLNDSHEGQVNVESTLPHYGEIRYGFLPNNKKMSMRLAFRIPYWSASTELRLNGNVIPYETLNGYAYINSSFTAEDTLTLHFDMTPKAIYSNTTVAANSQKAALQRGPLIYCAEGIDNDGDVLSLVMKQPIGVKAIHSEELGGIFKLAVEGYRSRSANVLYSFDAPYQPNIIINFIPYYAWDNRGLNQMRVWLPYR